MAAIKYKVKLAESERSRLNAVAGGYPTAQRKLQAIP